MSESYTSAAASVAAAVAGTTNAVTGSPSISDGQGKQYPLTCLVFIVFALIINSRFINTKISFTYNIQKRINWARI